MPLPTDQQTVSTLGGTTQAQQPTITTALPTRNSYGNDMTLANRMNAGAEQMRASREGSGGGLSQPEAPKYDPFSRPGDGNGDSQKRQQEYEGLLRQAADPRNGSARDRAVMVQAAQGLLSPGLNLVQQQGQDYQSQLKAYDAAMQGGYGGSAPPAGDQAGLINGLAQIFGPQETPATPTAPADPNAPALPSSYTRASDYSGATQSTPAIPAPTTTVTDPTTPAVASALPTTNPYLNDMTQANNAGDSALARIQEQQIEHKKKQMEEEEAWNQINQEFFNRRSANSSIRRLDLSDLVGGVLM